ncbi:hypothetical protein GDO86_002909 [Hymenochirus boettgeri]|uniref:Uncharacterized protein n=1 Tax=Hymenochirus boettgeri TaxID=247094 RepID=A0A8T2JYT9_9PIPI|nr:hypothetical protein GDO86_002909 [Hymenochirus boettgeri]
MDFSPYLLSDYWNIGKIAEIANSEPMGPNKLAFVLITRFMFAGNISTGDLKKMYLSMPKTGAMQAGQRAIHGRHPTCAKQ